MVKQYTLKSCPFCKGTPIIKQLNLLKMGLYYSVQCCRCSANTKKQTKYEAIEQWNRRVTDEIQVPNDK